MIAVSTVSLLECDLACAERVSRMPIPGDITGNPADASVPPPPPPPPASAEDGQERPFDHADTTLAYATPPPPNRVKIALPHEPVSAAALQSSEEKRLRDQLDGDEGFQRFVDEVRREHDPAGERRRLLRHGLRVTKSISPALVKLAETVRRIVDCPLEVELFVEPGEQLQVQAVRGSHEKQAYVCLSSALIDRLPQRELLHLMGVELGHLLLGHDDYPLGPILASWRGRLLPEQIQRFLRWRRYAEIAADRLGLFCCQDFQIASDTYFKLASGVTTGKLAFNLSDFLEQLTEVRSLDEVEQDVQEWFGAQPFSPLRLRALELFSQTDTFRRGTRKGVGILSFAVMEERVDEFLAIFAPSFASSDDEVNGTVGDFVALAALRVACASGEPAGPALATLATLIPDLGTAEGRERLRSVEAQQLAEMVREKSAALLEQLIPVQRYQIVRDLVVIGAAGGAMDEAKFDALLDAAECMQVPLEFVEAVADELLLPDPFAERPATTT